MQTAWRRLDAAGEHEVSLRGKRKVAAGSKAGCLLAAAEFDRADGDSRERSARRLRARGRAFHPVSGPCRGFMRSAVVG